MSSTKMSKHISKIRHLFYAIYISVSSKPSKTIYILFTKKLKPFELQEVLNCFNYFLIYILRQIVSKTMSGLYVSKCPNTFILYISKASLSKNWLFLFFHLLTRKNSAIRMPRYWH